MGVKKARSRRDSGGGAEPVKVEKPRPQMGPITSPIEGLTKEQLRQELKKRGLKMTGTKTEMLQRLGNVMATVKRKTELFNSSQTNGETRRPSSKMLHNRREDEKAERERIVLWRRPLQTLTYFTRELSHNTRTFTARAMQYQVALALASMVLLALYVLHLVKGPHSAYLDVVRSKAVWCVYWLGLGVLSSVGLGTGLHTFLLYLGPHIATVTLAAYECGSLNFPSPPYPDEIVCPEQADKAWTVSILNIMSKVRLEAMMWGAGTALGELPPYFMARAARLSGYDPEDKDDLREFEELQKKKQNPESMNLMDRAKLTVERIVEKVGFLGILACASIPNPLFDLAGITCGHFLVPFWTFFGATLIGKALIKMHIQKMFVIIAFNEALLDRAVTLMAHVPYIGLKLQEPFKEFLVKQKQRLHRKTDSDLPAEGNILSAIFEKFVIAMILYFVVSIINSLAQSYHKRICKQRRNPSKHAKD